MKLKLYKVTCKGMTTCIVGSVTYGIAYVVAKDAEEAYQCVRSKLDKDDLGFTRDRALNKIELLAEEGKYPECGTILYIFNKNNGEM